MTKPILIASCVAAVLGLAACNYDSQDYNAANTDYSAEDMNYANETTDYTNTGEYNAVENASENAIGNVEDAPSNAVANNTY